MTTVLIDTSRTGFNKALLFENPETVITTERPADVHHAMQEIEYAVRNGYYAAGFFSYEMGYVLEPRLSGLLEKERKTPLLWFGLFDNVKKVDQTELRSCLDKKAGEGDLTDYDIKDFTFGLDREKYRQAFRRAQKYIASGDIYQLNLTFNAGFSFSGNPYALYGDISKKQKMKYGALIVDENFTVISASPELFIDTTGNTVLTAPMKGTAARGYTLQEDRNIKLHLSQDEKSRAENLMIVDLMRNDLSRISEIGSVQVSELFSIETYPTLHQMVSRVFGRTESNLSFVKWLQALYPSGSITGAPKIRAMELISEIEQEERGIYTGSVGVFFPEKEHPHKALFNVAIRTLVISSDGTGSLGIGSGVVSDSDADNEYDECILKMKFLTDPVTDFDLIETFAWSPEEGYLYYDYHMRRLAQSAEYFCFRCDIISIECRLREMEKEFGNSFQRVRLLLSEDGKYSITATAINPPDPQAVMRFVISDTSVSKENVYLYHKTTNRSFYDQEHEKQTGDNRCDEVIFLNEEGHLTEGSRTNLFIYKNGILLTPPISSGLLAGTLRAELIEKGQAIEQPLTLEDLVKAERIYLGNSVRGLLKAVNVTPFDL